MCYQTSEKPVIYLHGVIFDYQLEKNEYDIWLRKLNTRANIPELYVNNLWSLFGPINWLQISASHAAKYVLQTSPPV